MSWPPKWGGGGMGGFASRAILMPAPPIRARLPTLPHVGQTASYPILHVVNWLSPLPFLFLPADGPGFEALRREGAGQIQPAGGIGVGTPVSLEAWSTLLDRS